MLLYISILIENKNYLLLGQITDPCYLDQEYAFNFLSLSNDLKRTFIYANDQFNCDNLEVIYIGNKRICPLIKFFGFFSLSFFSFLNK